VLIAAENIKWVRKVHKTSAIAALGPVEQTPGTNITTDADLMAVARRTTGSSTAHISGTSAMMSRELGGVVGPDLLVHGVTGLSVADSSIMPLIPGAHICSTVYAVAEKVRPPAFACAFSARQILWLCALVAPGKVLLNVKQAADLIKARHRPKYVQLKMA
jgi:hypothetical protein